MKLCAIGFVRVCSGYIPHHKCCSVYVISRVQIAFHITLTPHHIKRFTSSFHHITPQLHNIPHHITTYMFHATSRRHLMLQHISPRTTTFYIWDHITLQSASVPPFHTTTSQSTSHTVHILHHSISTTIPHHTHIQHHSIFHTTPYSTSHYTTPDSTSHYTTTSWPFTSRHYHMWHHISSFSTSDITLQSHSTLHNTTIPHHHWHFTSFHI